MARKPYHDDKYGLKIIRKLVISETNFLTGENGSVEAAQEENLCQFISLLGYCVMSGSHEILEELVFQPIREGSSKLRVEDLAAYAYALEKRMETINTSASEEPYLKVLVEGLFELSKPAT